MGTPSTFRTVMIRILLAWILGLFGLNGPSPAFAEDVVRIMPLGDSITQGNRRQNSFRRELWHALRETGLQVDFVGSQRRNHWGGPPNRDFDLDHEGHWGWRLDQVLARIDQWTAASQPDIVLIHLGTNDLAQGKEPDAIMEELVELITMLRDQTPQVSILLAQLIDNAFLSSRIQALNRLIPTIQAHSTQTSPIIIVDHWTGFDPSEHTYDGTHPNDAGEGLMARKWTEALLPLLQNEPPSPQEEIEKPS